MKTETELLIYTHMYLMSNFSIRIKKNAIQIVQGKKKGSLHIEYSHRA